MREKILKLTRKGENFSQRNKHNNENRLLIRNYLRDSKCSDIFKVLGEMSIQNFTIHLVKEKREKKPNILKQLRKFTA